MPVYHITDPKTGQSVDLRGDGGPPTEQELEQIFSTLSPPRPSATSRFLSGAWENLNPMGLLEAASHPVDTATNLVRAQADQFRKASQDYSQGHYSEMVGHGAAGLLPIFGPPAARAGETIGGGENIAGGLGQAAGLLAPFAADAAISYGPKVFKTVAPDTANAIADTADAAANKRMVDVMGPKVGPNKLRLNRQAAKVAPEIAREPGLNAFSREGLAAKVADKLDEATTALDDAADARLASQQVKTAPILQSINAQIEQLTAQPVEANRPIPAIGPNGPEGRPMGKAVEPAPNAAQIRVLKQIRDEVSSLGPVAPYEAVRRIRQAWDQVAKVKFLPSTAQDALASQGEAVAAVKGTGALRDGLAAADPQSAAANAKYSLFKSANDVLAATQEAEQARPRVGRGLMARGSGAIAGGIQGGGVGALIGATVGHLLDKAAQLAPTLQIVVARRLAGLADALRSGDTAGATAIATRLQALTQAAHDVPGAQAIHLPPEFAPTDAPVAPPEPPPQIPGGQGPLRQQELRDKFGGQGQ